MLAREALDLAESSGDWAQRIDSLRLVAIIDESLGDYSASLNALRDALAISTKEDQTLISAYIQIQMSEGLATVGQWEEALKAVTSALPPLRQFNDRDNLFNAYAELISIYAARESALKDFDKALEYTNELKQLLGTCLLYTSRCV